MSEVKKRGRHILGREPYKSVLKALQWAKEDGRGELKLKELRYILLDSKYKEGKYYPDMRFWKQHSHYSQLDPIKKDTETFEISTQRLKDIINSLKKKGVVYKKQRGKFGIEDSYLDEKRRDDLIDLIRGYPLNKIFWDSPLCETLETAIPPTLKIPIEYRNMKPEEFFSKMSADEDFYKAYRMYIAQIMDRVSEHMEEKAMKSATYMVLGLGKEKKILNIEDITRELYHYFNDNKEFEKEPSTRKSDHWITIVINIPVPHPERLSHFNWSVLLGEEKNSPKIALKQ